MSTPNFPGPRRRLKVLCERKDLGVSSRVPRHDFLVRGEGRGLGSGYGRRRDPGSPVPDRRDLGGGGGGVGRDRPRHGGRSLETPGRVPTSMEKEGTPAEKVRQAPAETEGREGVGDTFFSVGKSSSRPVVSQSLTKHLLLVNLRKRGPGTSTGSGKRGMEGGADVGSAMRPTGTKTKIPINRGTGWKRESFPDTKRVVNGENRPRIRQGPTCHGADLRPRGVGIVVTLPAVAEVRGGTLRSGAGEGLEVDEP